MTVLQQSYESMALMVSINADRLLSIVMIAGGLAAGAAFATMV